MNLSSFSLLLASRLEALKRIAAVAGCALVAGSFAHASPVIRPHTGPMSEAPGVEGVRFECTAERLQRLLPAMNGYLHLEGIEPEWYDRHIDAAAGTVRYVLRTPATDTDTLTLSRRPEYAVSDDVLELPTSGGGTRTISTVSKKEIILALMQHGRLTEFSGAACDIEAFRDHVGVRQMTVAWAEKLEWGWPDGGPAKWNEQFWRRGTPHQGVSAAQAVMDTFLQQNLYEIGCYTATKLVVVQGALDYYGRVKKDAATLAALEARLRIDGEPLVHIEPGVMWDFETDFEESERTRAGKLLRIQYRVAPRNFVPGDWSYFLNTDPITYEKTGYEGSNAIYLGRDKFDDYYNDNDHSYAYRRKLDEVWQWRFGVFSRSRDADKIRTLTEEDFLRLEQTPANGGVLMDLRAYPYFFGFEDLPPVPGTDR